MFDVQQIQKRYKVSQADAVEIARVQAAAFDYGARGVPLDADEVEDDALFDIEQLEASIVHLPENAIRRAFDAAYRAGAAKAKRDARRQRAA